jgi:hypothetical protein
MKEEKTMSSGDWIALAALLLTIALLSNKNIRLLLSRVKLLFEAMHYPSLLLFTLFLISMFLGTILSICFPYLPFSLIASLPGFFKSWSEISLWINGPVAILYVFLIGSMIQLLFAKRHWNMHKQDIKEMYKRVLEEGEK